MSHRSNARKVTTTFEDIKKWSYRSSAVNEYRLAIIRTLDAHCDDPCRPCYQCNNTRFCPVQVLHATMALHGIADKAVWREAVNWSIKYFNKHPRP